MSNFGFEPPDTSPVPGIPRRTIIADAIGKRIQQRFGSSEERQMSGMARQQARVNPNLSGNQFHMPSWGGKFAQAGVAALDAAQLSRAYKRPGGVGLAVRHVLTSTYGAGEHGAAPAVRQVYGSEALESGGLTPGHLGQGQPGDVD